jgi:hypothetical protein
MSLSGVRPSYLAGAAAIAIGVMLAARAAWPASAAGNSVTPASNVAVNCEPGQQALVRQTVVKGEPHVAIQCVTSDMAQSVAYQGDFARPAYGVAGEPRLVPANYVVAADPAPRRVTRAVAPARSTASAGQIEQRRSWKKTALVIGGSAGAGAGIGGLIGGKKGALIGAAIGGGSAGLYEATKR